MTDENKDTIPVDYMTYWYPIKVPVGWTVYVHDDTLDRIGKLELEVMSIVHMLGIEEGKIRELEHMVEELEKEIIKLKKKK